MENVMVKATNAKGSEVMFPIPRDFMDSCLDFIGANAVLHGVFAPGEVKLDDLPADVQTEVRETLKAYHDCAVVFEHGKFNVSAGSCIKSHYNFDHFVCGRYRDDAVYTIEERRKNYEEQFGSKPMF